MTEGNMGYPGMEDYAARLLVENRVVDAMRVLRTGPRSQIPDKVACLLIGYLLDHCSNRSQLCQASWLLDEAATLPPEMEVQLREKQLAMFQKFGDVGGIAMVLRRIEKLDDVDR
jgi:hypothetical protein